MLPCYVTKSALHKAPTLIAWCCLTFDERVQLREESNVMKISMIRENQNNTFPLSLNLCRVVSLIP